MNFTDYYQILGVPRTATQDEIKKAYRKMAMKYHPDKTAGDKEAEDKFKAINEANEVLGDPEKRKKYDELGANWKQYENSGQQQYRGQGAGGFGGGEYFSGDDDQFSDFFRSFFGGGGGAGFGGQFSGHGNAQRKGRDYQAEVTITLAEAYHGATRQMEVEGETIRMTFKGVRDGQVLRVRGKGGAGMNGGPRGDVLVSVSVPEVPGIARKGDDLYVEAETGMLTAIAGGKVRVSALGDPVQLTVPKETDSGKLLRAKGKGMPKFGSKTGEHGDLYVRIKLIVPKGLSPEDVEALEAIINKTASHA
jgi:curved DNA-binding protein